MPRPTAKQLTDHVTTELAVNARTLENVEILSVTVDEEARTLDVAVRFLDDPADSHRHWTIGF